eukprot:259224_1
MLYPAATQRVPSHDNINEKDPHPLSDTSICSKIWNNVFHVWVLNILKLGALQHDEIPELPHHMSADSLYLRWRTIKTQRIDDNTSVSTLSMIYSVEKNAILWLILYGIVQFMFIIYTYYIFQYKLWVIFNNDEIEMDALIINTFQLFCILCLKSILYSYMTHQSEQLHLRISS